MKSPACDALNWEDLSAILQTVILVCGSFFQGFACSTGSRPTWACEQTGFVPLGICDGDMLLEHPGSAHEFNHSNAGASGCHEPRFVFLRVGYKPLVERGCPMLDWNLP